MVSALKSGLGEVSIRPVEERFCNGIEPPKVNAYAEQRMAAIRGPITPIRGYNAQEKKWETVHIIAHPILGKELLAYFRYELGVKDRKRFVEVLGDHSILTEATKEGHSKIHKDYHTFFSKIGKSEPFIQRLRSNIRIYLERYRNTTAPISLSTLAGEIVTVVIQNSVNGYAKEIPEPAYWVGKFLAPEEDQLKPVEEIDSVVAAHSKKEENTGASWFSKPLSFISNAAKSAFMTFTIDRHVDKIYKGAVATEETLPGYLRSHGHKEEEIKGNVKAGFFAQETMRNLLLFILYEYAHDKQRQEQDRQAAIAFKKNPSQAGLPEEIEKRVLEALHEYPTGGSTRIADTPLLMSWKELGKSYEYYIPPGEAIVYSPFVASHWASGWQDIFGGEKVEFASFDIEKLKQLSHLPFGAGQHKCPAEKFVTPVMGEVICEILSSSAIMLADSEQKCRLAISSTLQPDSEIEVILTMNGAADA